MNEEMVGVMQAGSSVETARSGHVSYATTADAQSYS